MKREQLLKITKQVSSVWAERSTLPWWKEKVMVFHYYDYYDENRAHGTHLKFTYHQCDDYSAFL